MKTGLFEVFPFNLSLDVFQNEFQAKSIHIDSFLTVIDSLNELECRVLKLRYEEGLTIEEVGEKLCVMPEKAVKLIETALRQLRKPYRISQFKAITYSEKLLLAQENTRLERENRMLQAACHEIRKANEPVIEYSRNMDEEESIMNAPIMKLSVSRTIWQALLRSDINTIGELQNYSFNDLMRLRGVGVTSAEKIEQALDELGIKLSR